MCRCGQIFDSYLYMHRLFPLFRVPIPLQASWMSEQALKPLSKVKAPGSHKPKSIRLLQKRRGTKPNYAKLFRGSRPCRSSFSGSLLLLFSCNRIYEILNFDSWIRSLSRHPCPSRVRHSFDLFLKLAMCMSFIIGAVTALHLEGHESRAGRKVSFCVAERDWEG